jgi:hypothetical protein
MNERSKLLTRFYDMKSKGMIDMKFDFSPAANAATVEEVCEEVNRILDAVESAGPGGLKNHRFNDSHRGPVGVALEDIQAGAVCEIDMSTGKIRRMVCGE